MLQKDTESCIITVFINYTRILHNLQQTVGNNTGRPSTTNMRNSYRTWLRSFKEWTAWNTTAYTIGQHWTRS